MQLLQSIKANVGTLLFLLGDFAPSDPGVLKRQVFYAWAEATHPSFKRDQDAEEEVEPSPRRSRQLGEEDLDKVLRRLQEEFARRAITHGDLEEGLQQLRSGRASRRVSLSSGASSGKAAKSGWMPSFMVG